MKRYGFADEANKIAEAVFRAASYFAMNQLPELYAGVQRDTSNFPVQYLGANVPQGWAAGSTFTFLQAILGIQPDAANNVLYIDPSLPSWLPDVTLRDLRLGPVSFDIRFHQEHDTTVWTVMRGPDKAVVRRRATAASPAEIRLPAANLLPAK
jgi:glycogen debranching enzyme